MTYDFDKTIDRKGTNAVKTDAMQKLWGRTDLIPLWVADMDFETPRFIMDALRERMEHPVLGYTLPPRDFRPTIIEWIRTHHDWEVKREWITYIPGIVRGIGMVVNVFTQPGDKVIIQPPVYHPFRLVPEGNGRQIVNNPLTLNADGHYEMDFENLAEIVDEKCKVLILSNPHNPAGICWDRQTLERLAHFCNEHGILVVSDEIHNDFVFEGEHTIFANVKKEFEDISIICTSPSKTFNLAGMLISNILIPRLMIWCGIIEERQ
jgi:cystathionine beta-lyase